MAAAATMLAACSQSDVLNEVQVQEEAQAIGFGTYAGKLTRAENSYQTETTGLNLHHESFIVWGYKNTADAYVFNGESMSYNTNSWTYTNTKYWDKAAKTYQFYAAAPNTGKWVLMPNTEAKGDDYFKYVNFGLEDETLSATTYSQSFKEEGKNNIDLMIASPKKVEQYQIQSAEKVVFQFNHILSRLNITVNKSNKLTSAQVALKSIVVSGLRNTGTFSEETEAVVAGTTTRWTKFDYTYNLTGNKLDQVSTTAQYVLQSLVIPQKAAYQDIDRDGSSEETAPYIYLEYTIGDELYKATYNLANAFHNAEQLAFNEGWQNTLNITIDADEIEFDAVVYKWYETGDGEELTI